MNSDISVVIPAYNAAAYLGEAVQSAVMQSEPPLEVLVVDDGSVDASRAIAAESGARVLTTGSNRGPGSARNVGIAAASGTFVAFLDADDVWLPTHLAMLRALLDRHPGAALAFSLIRKFGAVDLAPPPAVPENQLLDLGEKLWLLNPVPQSAVLARRSALADVAGYEDGMRLSEDYDLWFRLAAKHRFVCSHERTVRYRVHAAQTTASVGRMLRAAWGVRLRHWDSTVASAPDADRARITAMLVQAFDDDMKSAWHYRTPEPLAAMLEVSQRTPLQAEKVSRHWRRRVRYLRRSWLAAARVVDFSRHWSGSMRRRLGWGRLA